MNSHDKKYNLLTSTLGPLILRLLENPDVIEIMANPDGSLHIETLSSGKELHPESISAQQVNNIIKIIAANKSHIVTQQRPELSVEIPQFHARFQGWIPPVVESPCFSLRKHGSQILTLENYIEQGLITQEQTDQLRTAIADRKNIIVSGGTSSGKTTFTNALLAELKNSSERILVLEDLPELQINSSDYVKLQTTDNITMRDLVKGVLRMRPDRIIIGEVRDGSALDVLKAWNTGHPGGICTLHANSAAMVKPRLSELIREVTSHVPETLLNQCINVIVHLERGPDGHRKVKEIISSSEIDNV